MPRLVKHSLLLLCPLLLVGCLGNHAFQVPTLAIDNRWSVALGPSKPAVPHLEYTAWWMDFHDDTLNALIKRGLACNNSLNESRGKIEAAEGELQKIRYQWIPTLDSLLGYSRNPATGFPGTIVAIIPNYTLNLWHQMKQQKRAKYQLAVAKAADDALKLTVISQLVAGYFTYQAELERKLLLARLAHDTAELATITARLYHGGLDTNIPTQTRYSAANTVYGTQAILERNLVFSRNAIRYLLNENPGDLSTTLRFSQLSTHHLVPGQLPLTVLETRPDMQIAENQLRAANEAIDLAASDWLPSIQLDLIEGLIAGDNAYHWPTEPIYFNDQLLQLPLIRASVLGDVARAKGLNKAAFYHYLDTFQNALRNTTNALAAHHSLTQKLEKTQRAQRHLAKAYALNNRLYQRGIESYLNTLQSKIKLDQANLNVNRDKLNQLLTLVTLYQELAGGYQSDTHMN